MASELKCLHRHPRFSPEISERAFQDYVHFNYIRSPLSIFQGIYKLPPATCLKLSLEKLCDGIDSSSPGDTPKTYWVAPKTECKTTVETALSEFERVLSEAISLQMVADVPVGAFLSGGIDSSLIVALMQRYSSTKIKTFTIGFDEKSHDESPYAKRIADYLGTEYQEQIVTAQMCLDLVPKIATLYDEPFSDSSQIPTFLVSKLAHKQVTVSLSGDGGDELFGGYTRYFKTKNIWEILNRLPKIFHTTLTQFSQRIPDEVIQKVSLVLGHNRIQKFFSLVRNPSLEMLYELLLYNIASPNRLIAFQKNDLPRYLLSGQPENSDELLRLLLESDFKNYLPDDILVKVDRATMGNSLESRAPFLDHRVVEFAHSLPIRFKIHAGVGKVLTRRLLEKYVPLELFERPKMGFGLPIGIWMRNELRAYCEELFSVDSLAETGLWNTQQIQSYWQLHLNGKGNYEYLLWNVLIFQAWVAEWITKGKGNPAFRSCALT